MQLREEEEEERFQREKELKKIEKIKKLSFEAIPKATISSKLLSEYKTVKLKLKIETNRTEDPRRQKNRNGGIREKEKTGKIK